MPYNIALIQGCEEYRLGYAAALPLLLKAARVLAETTPQEQAAAALKEDAALRQTVTTAMEVAMQTELGPRGRHAQSLAYDHALEYAAVRAYSGTDFGGLSNEGVIG